MVIENEEDEEEKSKLEDLKSIQSQVRKNSKNI